MRIECELSEVAAAEGNREGLRLAGAEDAQRALVRDALKVALPPNCKA